MIHAERPQAEVLQFPVLSRRGSQLSWGTRTWDMVGVHGPLRARGGGRQYFRVITAEGENLIVYREKGEKGMRQLYLFCLDGGKGQN